MRNQCGIVDLPAISRIPGHCALLRRCLYGTRDAARNWDSEVSKTMAEGNFKKGLANPCLHHHAQRDLASMVHGDDILIEGRRRDVEKAVAFIRSKYEVRMSMIGADYDLDNEMQMLNRVIGIDSQGYYLRADQRHADQLVKDLGLESACPCATPGRRGLPD